MNHAVSLMCTATVGGVIGLAIVTKLDSWILPFQHQNMTEDILEKKIDTSIADQIQIKNRIDELERRVIIEYPTYIIHED